MPSDDSKTRRTRSTSVNSQLSYDDCVGSETDDVFHPKRITVSSVILFYTRKVLVFSWQCAAALLESVLRTVKKCRHHYNGNLKWFLHNHPPMVLFTLSISLFAVLLNLLAFYVSKTSLSKVDVSQDWNVFLQGFSDLEFCVIHDNSTSKALPGNVLKPGEKAVENSSEKDIRSHSVTMSVTIYPTKEFVSIPHHLMHLSTSMGVKYIGLKGDDSQQRLNITFVVPYSWNASSCSIIPLQGCQAVKMDVCVQLTGSNYLFPDSKRQPKSCPMSSVTGVDYWAKMNWQLGEVDSPYYCRSRTMIGIQHEYDPLLFQPLKKPHRSVIRQHLLHTSFFLYVYVAVVFVYAVAVNHAKHARMSKSGVPV